MLYKNNGTDRYPDFKLYKMIARCVHNHTPQAQLERPEFKAFLYDGNSFRNLRNTYDPYFKERATIKLEKKEEGHSGAAHETGATHEAAADTTAHASDTAALENKH